MLVAASTIHIISTQVVLGIHMSGLWKNPLFTYNGSYDLRLGHIVFKVSSTDFFQNLLQEGELILHPNRKRYPGALM